jgi:hypothetical protein
VLSTSAGVAWLADITNHATRVVALAGLLIGASVASFFTSSGVGLATVAALVALAFFEGAFQTWRSAGAGTRGSSNST